jgi:hypothetical protein
VTRPSSSSTKWKQPLVDLQGIRAEFQPLTPVETLLEPTGAEIVDQGVSSDKVDMSIMVNDRDLAADDLEENRSWLCAVNLTLPCCQSFPVFPQMCVKNPLWFE